MLPRKPRGQASVLCTAAAAAGWCSRGQAPVRMMLRRYHAAESASLPADACAEPDFERRSVFFYSGARRVRRVRVAKADGVALRAKFEA